MSQNKRSPFADIARSVWMAAAQQQVLEHMKATIENRRLKALVETNADVLSKLQALLQQCSLDKVRVNLRWWSYLLLLIVSSSVFFFLDGTFDASRSGGIPSSVRRRNPHSATLDQLIASTDQSYQQVDNVFRQCCLDLTAPSSCTAPEMLIDGAGTSSHEFLVRKYSHFSSSKQGELFGTSPRSVSVPLRDATSTMADSRRNRLAVHVRPVLFGGKCLQGAAFKETGFFLIHHHPLIPSKFALLQTCYVITPRTPMPQLPTDPLAREVTDFVLKCMAQSIPRTTRSLKTNSWVKNHTACRFIPHEVCKTTQWYYKPNWKQELRS
ncbi:hypothetical protein GQ600_9743 [Phytophthora cactorum]|nr:hypothetical protein GQ600_9743 [Phytophthora cactorum]